MNRAASNLTDRKELQRDVQNEKLLKAEGSGNKEVILGKKVGWLLQGCFPLGDGQFYRADDLTN